MYPVSWKYVFKGKTLLLTNKVSKNEKKLNKEKHI